MTRIRSQNGSKNRAGIGRKRELASDVRSTKFWFEDDHEFTRVLQKKGCTPADLLRQIVHEWATRQRLGSLASDDIEMSVRRVHEKIVAEQVGPIKEGIQNLRAVLRDIGQAIADQAHNDHIPAPSDEPSGQFQSSIEELLGRLESQVAQARTELSQTAKSLLTAASRITEQLSIQEVVLERLTTAMRAHYLLTGQTFSAGWATLDFIQRYIAEPMLKSINDDPYQAAITHRDEARQEGLQLVARMSQEFQFPGTLKLLIFTPADDQP